MDVAGICAICGKPYAKCVTCKLCGIIVCIGHQRGGICANCAKGRIIGHRGCKK